MGSRRKGGEPSDSMTARWVRQVFPSMGVIARVQPWSLRYSSAAVISFWLEGTPKEPILWPW